MQVGSGKWLDKDFPWNFRVNSVCFFFAFFKHDRSMQLMFESIKI